MTRDEAVELFRREVVPGFVQSMEIVIQEDSAVLSSRGYDPSMMRAGMSDESAALLLDVAREFVAYVKAWRSSSRQGGPDV
jgi:hypothetical protein